MLATNANTSSTPSEVVPSWTGPTAGVKSKPATANTPRAGLRRILSMGCQRPRKILNLRHGLPATALRGRRLHQRIPRHDDHAETDPAKPPGHPSGLRLARLPDIPQRVSPSASWKLAVHPVDPTGYALQPALAAAVVL